MNDGIPNPFLEFLGARMTRWDEALVAFELPMRPQFLNRSGRVQGGVLCTLLDTAAGYAGVWVPDGTPQVHAVTLSLTTQFLNSGTGDRLVSRGQVMRRGRGIFFASSEVLLDGDVVLASAVGTFKYVRSD